MCSFKGDPEEEDKKFDSYLGVENDPDSTVKLERGVTPGKLVNYNGTYKSVVLNIQRLSTLFRITCCI